MEKAGMALVRIFAQSTITRQWPYFFRSKALASKTMKTEKAAIYALLLFF